MKKIIKDNNENILNKLIYIFDNLKKKNKIRKFIESIDVSINLNINYKDLNSYIYGNVLLPHGNGKKYKIAVFDNYHNKDLIYSLGAYIVGGKNLINKIINDKNIDFNLVITTNDFVDKISKIAYILGPKGLMPNIKFGTITNNIENTLKDFLNGKIIYKNDKFGIIHLSIGRIDFDSYKLADNLFVLINSIKNNKFLLIKNSLLIKKVTVSSTMGKSYLIKI